MQLVVASLNYSSWSARAWVTLTHAGIDFETVPIAMFIEDDWRDRLLAYSPAGKVPILLDGDLTVHESLAICEYVNEIRREAKLWPEDRSARARARAVSAEMASGFPNLRNKMGMNDRARATHFSPDADTRSEIDRVIQLWSSCRAAAPGGPFLFGHFSIADAMYMPVLSRFRSYGIELAGAAAEYAAAMWDQPAVRAWSELAKSAPAVPRYDALPAFA